MRQETRNVPVDGATGGNASTPLDIKDLRDVMLVVASTGVANGGGNADTFSVKIQATVKGGLADVHGAWFDVTGAIAGDALVPLDRTTTTDIGGYAMPFTHVRVFVTTKGTAPPKVLCSGVNSRTE